jgi:hypothetical protein
VKLKFLVLTLVVALFLGLVASGSQVAQARVDSVTAASVTCSEFGASGAFSSAGGDRKVGLWVYNLDAGATIAFGFVAGPAGSGTYSATVGYSVPANTNLYVDISTYPASATGPAEWDGEQYFAGTLNCSVAKFNGPSAPSGAELKTITCDVAVFDEPGGSPVGSNRIKAGQTWYVIPGVKADASGKNWVQVYVSGFGLPWIPASCVPGAEAAKIVNTGVSRPVITTGNVSQLPVGTGSRP